MIGRLQKMLPVLPKLKVQPTVRHNPSPFPFETEFPYIREQTHKYRPQSCSSYANTVFTGVAVMLYPGMQQSIRHLYRAILIFRSLPRRR